MTITKKFAVLSLIAIALLSISVLAETTLSELKLKTTATCNGCKAKIEKAFKSNKGVKEVNLNLEDKYVTIKYNPEQTNETELKGILNKIGYSAESNKDQNTKETQKENCQKPCDHEKNDPNCCKNKNK